MKKYRYFTLIFLISVIMDQVSKIWVTKNIQGPRNPEFLEKIGVSFEEVLKMPDSIPVIPGFFSIVHTQNQGAAFGIMQGQMWVFGVFTLVAMGVIIWTLVQLPDTDRFQNFALALLASGTIGNAIDRVHKQSVTDFLHVYSEHPKVTPILKDVLGSTAWPSFNIADAAIVIGMIMFVIFYLFLEKDEEDKEDMEPEEGRNVDALEGLS